MKWCVNATNHSKTYGGKPWKYLLIPHDEILENITLNNLAERFGSETKVCHSNILPKLNLNLRWNALQNYIM